MKKREMSLINPALVNAAQVGELVSPFISEVLKLTPERQQYWIGNKGKLQWELQKIFSFQKTTDEQNKLQSWVDLYRDCFGLELDLSIFRISKYQPNTWLIPLHESLTEQAIYSACKKYFSCNDMDFSAIRDLHRKGTTIRRFEANDVADEKYQNKSANNLRKAGLEPKAITLKERMLLELWHFLQPISSYEKHLDFNGYQTLCNGSCNADGDVPSVYWSNSNRKFCLDLIDPNDRDYGLRSRVAVL